jgi:hypothetical protein
MCMLIHCNNSRFVAGLQKIRFKYEDAKMRGNKSSGLSSAT